MHHFQALSEILSRLATQILIRSESPATQERGCRSNRKARLKTRLIAAIGAIRYS